MGAQAERGVPVGGPSGGDHPRAGLARQLHRDRTHASGGAVDHHRLSGGEPPVVEQALPRGQSGDGQRGGDDVVDVGGQRGQIAGLDGGVLGQGSVTGPVRHAEDVLADRQSGRAVAQLLHHPRQLVSGHAGGPRAAGAVGPGRRPVEFAPREAGGVHPYNDVVLGGVRIGQFGERESLDTRVGVVDGDGAH